VTIQLYAVLPTPELSVASHDEFPADILINILHVAFDSDCSQAEIMRKRFERIYRF
jgi:hypothetical protein